MHVESDGNIEELLGEFKAVGIKTGIALLKPTSVSEYARLIEFADHLLIFSGSLGRFGGGADYSLFDKITEARKLHPGIEIGWDGGVNKDDASDLVRAGVNVLNVGGFIQRAEDPRKAYGILNKAISGVKGSST